MYFNVYGLGKRCLLLFMSADAETLVERFNDFLFLCIDSGVYVSLCVFVD